MGVVGDPNVIKFHTGDQGPAPPELLASTRHEYVDEYDNDGVVKVVVVVDQLVLTFVSSKLLEFGLVICKVYDVAPVTAVQLNVGAVAMFVALFAGFISCGADRGAVVKLQVCDHELDVIVLLACTCQ